MKSQRHNVAELTELKVKIEESVVSSIVEMAQNSEMPLDDIVVIALKRFIASHSDYQKKKEAA